MGRRRTRSRGAGASAGDPACCDGGGSAVLDTGKPPKPCPASFPVSDYAAKTEIGAGLKFTTEAVRQ